MQAPYTQYGPYSGLPESLSAHGKADHNQFEVMSAGGQPMYKSPQTMQEFQYSNPIPIDDLQSDASGSKRMAKNMPSYHSMKDKLNNIRKQNITNVTTNILGNSKGGQAVKARELRAKNTEDDTATSTHQSNLSVSTP